MKILLIACKAGKAIQGSVLVTLAVTPMLPLAVGGSPGGQGGLLIRDPLRLKSSAVNSLCVQILAHRAGTFRSTPSPLFELYFISFFVVGYLSVKIFVLPGPSFLSFKPGVGQNVVLHAFFAAGNCTNFSFWSIHYPPPPSKTTTTKKTSFVWEVHN